MGHDQHLGANDPAATGRLASALQDGIAEVDREGGRLEYRTLRASDDLEIITAMLHEAYAPLAAAGMRFRASHQDSRTTRERTEGGETIVVTDSGLIVGIVTLKDADATTGAPFFDRPEVAAFEQLAVRPSHQGRGIGSRLIALVEERAREKGVGVLALDTAETATRLVSLYEARGFRVVGTAQWSMTNYRSVILAKTLD